MAQTVLLGPLAPVLRLGLRLVLRDAGCVVLVDGSRGPRRTSLRRVDAVILDLDAPACLAEAEVLARHRPALRIVACSARRPAMRRLPRGPEEPLDAERLVAAVGA